VTEQEQAKCGEVRPGIWHCLSCFHCGECDGPAGVAERRTVVWHAAWCEQGKRVADMRAGLRPWQQQ
jgi:hypothetical protein